jgi:hypothetical protein
MFSKYVSRLESKEAYCRNVLDLTSLAELVRKNRTGTAESVSTNLEVKKPVEVNTVLSIYIETSVRNKCRCSFYCALLTLHVSAPIGGHLQVVL